MQQLARGFRVAGRVQGVGFRYSTRRRAEALGLGGRVRNRADGQVEGAVWGEAQAVETFLAWLHEGPRHARVSEVETWEVEPGHAEGFEITR